MQITQTEIAEFAEVCTQAMGDVFWDRDAYDPQGQEYPEPHAVAAESIRECLSEFLTNRGVRIDSV